MKNLIIGAINTYKNSSGKLWLSGPFILYSNCKYHPTCSEYAAQAVEKYGLLKGLAKGILRIFKCNPLSHGGVDLP